MCTEIQSSTDFLKSAQGKILSNKRKAEPDMRVEALLGSACKRIRCEIISQSRNKSGHFVNQTKSSNLETVSNFGATENTCNSLCFDFNENCSGDFIGQLDDAKQVEIFLREVENQCQTEIRNKENTFDAVDNMNNNLHDISEKINSYGIEPVVEAELDLYTDFESLYEELLDSLASVEKWMALASADNENIEKSQNLIYKNQSETFIDFSTMLDVTK